MTRSPLSWWNPDWKWGEPRWIASPGDRIPLKQLVLKNCGLETSSAHVLGEVLRPGSGFWRPATIVITCQALSLLRRLGVGGQSGQMAVALPFHIDGYLRYVFVLVPTQWFVVGKMVQDLLVIGSTAFLMLQDIPISKSYHVLFLFMVGKTLPQIGPPKKRCLAPGCRFDDVSLFPPKFLYHF